MNTQNDVISSLKLENEKLKNDIIQRDMINKVLELENERLLALLQESSELLQQVNMMIKRRLFIRNNYENFVFDPHQALCVD